MRAILAVVHWESIFFQSEKTRGAEAVSSQKELVLNLAWCKGCGICAAFCPKGALELRDGKAALAENAQCVLCGQCELRCPDYAIYLKEAEGGDTQWVKPY